MSVVESDKENQFCSFCMTPGGQTRTLAGGHGAWICGDCVDRFQGSFASTDDRSSVITPSWESMGNEELMDVLPRIVAAQEQHDGFLRDWVDMLREQGISWHQIGLALGVSRQAVWQRFARRPEATTP